MRSDRDIVQRYADIFASLTPDRLDLLCACVDETVRFKDPFNDVRGKEAFRRIFEHMFAHTLNPVFTITDIAISPQQGFINWDFKFQPKDNTSIWHICGVSIVTINDKGLIASHSDYWDAAELFYENLPVIGWLLRLIKRRMRVS